MIPGLERASAPAAWAMMGASSDTGLRHLPAIRARVTWIPSPGGAKWVNWGSLSRLTDGMIRPIPAAGTSIWSSPAFLIATASMFASLVRTEQFSRFRCAVPLAQAQPFNRGPFKQGARPAHAESGWDHTLSRKSGLIQQASTGSDAVLRVRWLRW